MKQMYQKSMKSIITKTTVNNGHGIIDKKESCKFIMEQIVQYHQKVILKHKNLHY